FDLLVKPQIKMLEIPSQRCVELVYEELIKICHTCGSTELTRFPRLQAKLIEVVSDLLRERLGPASQYVESLISIQRAYINTNHPNFLGAAAAMGQVVSSRQEKERKRLIHEERERRERRRLKDLNANGTDTPENDEAASPSGRGEVSGLKKHQSKQLRSMSPSVRENGTGGIAAAINGRSSSPSQFNSNNPPGIGNARDSFLNYFFGKDGAAHMVSPGAPGRHASQNLEPSFAQSMRHGDDKIAHRPAAGREEEDAGSASILGDLGAPFVSFSPQTVTRRVSDTLIQSAGAEPAMTDRESMETDLIRALISSYFNIVRETTADQVPKAIMHLLVNHCKDVVQNRLVSELYKESLFEELLYEDDGVKKEREKCEGLLQTYREASKIIGEVL
ncbi:hypothetical protein IMZ48_23300, partial [Candidatus Bathyarchaeota archaeon]|nr:hypothetical protein [Candidatus Bathyarchaeota archaeon]